MKPSERIRELFVEYYRKNNKHFNIEMLDKCCFPTEQWNEFIVKYLDEEWEKKRLNNIKVQAANNLLKPMRCKHDVVLGDCWECK